MIVFNNNNIRLFDSIWKINIYTGFTQTQTQWLLNDDDDGSAYYLYLFLFFYECVLTSVERPSLPVVGMKEKIVYLYIYIQCISFIRLGFLFKQIRRFFFFLLLLLTFITYFSYFVVTIKITTSKIKQRSII